VRSKSILGFGLAAPLLAVTMAHATLARAQTAPEVNAQSLDTLQQQIQAGQAQQAQLKAQADALDKEIADLQASAVKAAGQVQDTETQVTQLEDTLAALSDEEKDKTAALESERGKLTRAVLAMQRLSTQPPEALMFSSQSPIDAARTARLLSIITPALDARARALQSDLNELTEMRQEMAQRRDELAGAVSKLATQNTKLASLINKKADAQRSTLAQSAAAQSKLDKLAGQAKNLQDLVDRLNKAKVETGPAVPAGTPQTAALSQGVTQNALPERMERPAGFRNFPDSANLGPQNVVFAPARGHIVTHFGDPTETGGASKGLVLETRPGAQIVAPFDGRIAFEGPFRSYGQILIIEHGGGYHTVLAGLDRVDAVVGQWLLAGEPVGVMGAGEGSGDTASTGRPKLYLELRRDGQPIDPVPWFGTADTKTAGVTTAGTNAISTNTNNKGQ
jgi:septal ring factor EnvC (AmiA/AmiB activator)